MCTSFVFRHPNRVLVAMNFDNDGKAYTVSATEGQGFTLAAKVGSAFFASVGVNANGVFVNDQMVASNPAGVYKRQSPKRWTNSRLVDTLLTSNLTFNDTLALLNRVEIVNVPDASTHNLIVDSQGNLCVVEPGRGFAVSPASDTAGFVLTNFSVLAHPGWFPQPVAASDCARYGRVVAGLRHAAETMTVETAWALLEAVQQRGPVWTTALSLVYDATHRCVHWRQPHDAEICTIHLSRAL